MFLIIIGLAGIAIVIKGECRASSKRVVRGWAALVVGVMFIVAAGLAWVPRLSVAVPLGLTLAAIVLGLVTARPDEERSRS